MRKNFIFLLLACITLVSCEKSSIKNCLPMDEISLEGAITIKQGNFDFNMGETSGIAKIHLQKNGRYVLGMEQMNISQTNEFEVSLSETSSVSATTVELFSAKSIQGEKYYLLPKNINVTNYAFVIIHDDQKENSIASAALK